MLPLLALLLPLVSSAGPDCAGSWRPEVESAVGASKDAWACLCREHATAEAAMDAAKRKEPCGAVPDAPAQASAPESSPAAAAASRAADAAAARVAESLKAGGIQELYGEKALAEGAPPPPPPPGAVPASGYAPRAPALLPASAPAPGGSPGVAALQAGVSGPPHAHEAVERARELVGVMLAHADPDVVANLVRRRVRVVVIGRHQKLTDAPEFADLRGKKTFDGRPWEGVRGVGSYRLADGSWALAVAEENLDDSGGGGYPPRYLFVHEFAHMVQLRGLPTYNLGAATAGLKARGEAQAAEAVRSAATGGQRRRAQLFLELAKRADGVAPTYESSLRLFKADKARPGRVPLNEYADSNADEFFAEATAAYFGVEFKGKSKERLADLLKSRPDLAVFLYKVYGAAPVANLLR